MMLPLVLWAQEGADCESVRVYFRQGSSTLESGYMDNAAAMQQLSERLQPYVLDMDSTKGKGRVRISSSVSPEGSNAINDRLIKARAKSISDWVSKQFNVEIGYIVDSMGVDWTELTALVEASDKVPAKEQVLNILRNTPEKATRGGKVVNERQLQLQRLQKGVPYQYIYKNIYPRLRYAAAYTEIWYAPVITITTPTQQQFVAAGGEGTIVYTQDENDKAQPKVSCNANWITDLQHNGNQVTFRVEPNTVAKARKANIVLNHYDELYTVEVSQEAAEAGLTFTTAVPVELDAIGGRSAVSFITNTEESVVPTAQCDAEWVSNVKCSASRISFTVASNTIAEPRSAVVRVEALGKSYDVVINQQAAASKGVTATQGGDAITTPQLVLDRSESVRVYFRQGSAEIDQKYMNNGETLKRLAELLEPYVVDGAEEKGKVRISSSVSPEGSIAINDRLVKNRARAIAKWISKRFNVEIGYVVGSMGVDWEAMIMLIEDDEKVPYREEVLDILYNTPERATRNGKVVNEREVQLQRLRKGVPYRYIYRNIYPKLRYAAAYTEIWYASEMTITSESPINFTSEGGDGVVTFQKNVDDKVVPRVTCTADWVEGVVADGSSVKFAVKPNEMAEPRSTKMYLECYGKMYDVVINQEGAEPVCVITSGESQNFTSEGGQGTVTYTTNTIQEVTPSVESGSEWVRNITVGPEGISYEVAPNEVAAPRSDTLLVSCFEQTHKVIVNQEGAAPRFDIASERNYDYKGAADTLAFTHNSPEKIVPVVSSENEWIKDLASTEDNISYKVERNRGKEERSGVVKVESFAGVNEVVVNQAASECRFPLYLAVKTNALYDLALIPNIGAELYLGKNFSAGINWHYAWWKSDKVKWYWRTYGGDVYARYWFGKAAKEKPLTGHHIGLYGQIITYDFELGKKGIQSNFWNYGGGVEYGYTLPLAYRLNLDLTVGVGYNTGQFYEYLPIDDCYVWQATKNRRYIGPTKVEASLVWLFGCDNYNRVKGGDR